MAYHLMVRVDVNYSKNSGLSSVVGTARTDRTILGLG
jgi:hypothetical protein